MVRQNVRGPILLLAFCTGSLSVAIAAIETLSRTFPEVSSGLVLLVGNLPALAAVLVSLVSAGMYRMLGYKQTAILSVLMVGLGGAMPLVFKSFAAVLISRFVMGCGYGLCSVLPPTLIGISLAGDKSQQSFYGYQIAMLGLAGTVFGQLGGWMTEVNVNYMWALHLAFLLIIPVIVFCMKEPTDEELRAQDEGDSGTAGAGSSLLKVLPAIFFAYIILSFIEGCTHMGWYLNVSNYTSEFGLSNPAAFAGTVVAAAQIGTFVGGIALGRISKITKRYTVVLAVVFFGCCAALTLTRSSWLLVVAGVLFGLADSIFYSTGYTVAGYLVPGEANGLASGVFNAFVQTGIFFGPYIILFISGLMGYGEAALPQVYILLALTAVNIAGYFFLVRSKGAARIAECYDAAAQE